MKRLMQTAAVATLSLTGIISGCNSQATTNTDTLRSGKHHTVLEKGRIDWAKMEHDNYAFIDRNTDLDVKINGRIVPSENIIDTRLIPFSNSATTRSEKSIMSDTAAPSFMVNCFYDQSGQLNINYDKGLKESDFRLSEKSPPQGFTSDQINEISRQTYERFAHDPNKITIRGEEYIPLLDIDPMGRKSKVYVWVDTAREFHDTIRTPGPDPLNPLKGMTSKELWGITGVGFYALPGTEVEKQRTEEELLKVISGSGQYSYISTKGLNTDPLEKANKTK